jgi:hypothetical protein
LASREEITVPGSEGTEEPVRIIAYCNDKIKLAFIGIYRVFQEE